MTNGSQKEQPLEEQLILGASLNLIPQTVREHILTLHYRQLASEKEQEYLKSSVRKLDEARVREFKCPFNPDVGGNGHELLDEVKVLSEELSNLKGIKEQVDYLKTKANQFEGAINFVKWIGFSSIGGIIFVLIRLFIFGGPIK